MTDRDHHGEGQHDQRDMTVPALPGSGLVVVEAQFVLGRLEVVLDDPAIAPLSELRDRIALEIVREIACPIMASLPQN